MARVTSDIFVTAFMRTVRIRGGQAYLVRRGATEAGAIFIALRVAQTGHYRLFEPAPQSFGGDERDNDMATIADGRKFTLSAQAMTETEMSERYQKEERFDPDFWIVEVEDLDLIAENLLAVVGES